MKALRPGAEQLTVEAAIHHVELLDVRESAPFRRNSTSRLVRNEIATRQIDNLKRNWKHLWQRTCANTAPISVAKTKPRSMGADQLTVEAHAVQPELFELLEDCHVGCNRPAQLVAAKRELFEICEWRK